MAGRQASKLKERSESEGIEGQGEIIVLLRNALEQSECGGGGDPSWCGPVWCRGSQVDGIAGGSEGRNESQGALDGLA